LGIGANTAMFSMAEAFLVHPVPFENADRIVALIDSRPGQNIDMTPVAPATISIGSNRRIPSINSLVTLGVK